MSNLTLDEINAAITEVAEIARQAQEIINNPTVFYTSRTIEAGVKHMTECKRAYQTSLAALRECAERRTGCEYCKGGKPLLQGDDNCMDTVRIMFAKNGTGAHYLIDEVGKHLQWAIKITKCPMCGHELTTLAYDHEPGRSGTDDAKE